MKTYNQLYTYIKANATTDRQKKVSNSLSYKDFSFSKFSNTFMKYVAIYYYHLSCQKKPKHIMKVFLKTHTQFGGFFK